MNFSCPSSVKFEIEAYLLQSAESCVYVKFTLQTFLNGWHSCSFSQVTICAKSFSCWVQMLDVVMIIINSHEKMLLLKDSFTRIWIFCHLFILFYFSLWNTKKIPWKCLFAIHWKSVGGLILALFLVCS